MTATQQEERESKGLRAGAIGLVGSIVVGIASTAPAYSLAASLGYVVVVKSGDGIVGTKAPLIPTEPRISCSTQLLVSTIVRP